MWLIHGHFSKTTSRLQLSDYVKLRDAVSAANISDCIKDMNVADSWSFLKDKVTPAVDECLPKIKLDEVK
jgi:hypothetical protein